MLSNAYDGPDATVRTLSEPHDRSQHVKVRFAIDRIPWLETVPRQRKVITTRSYETYEKPQSNLVARCPIYLENPMLSQ